MGSVTAKHGNVRFCFFHSVFVRVGGFWYWTGTLVYARQRLYHRHLHPRAPLVLVSYKSVFVYREQQQPKRDKKAFLCSKT